MTHDPRVGAVAALVDGFAPSAERAAAARRQLLAALASLPRPLDGDAQPTHVTASAIVLGPDGVLLHRHKRLGRWLQPGGHVDRDEAPADAALREVREETGLVAAHPLAGPALVDVDAHCLPQPCRPWAAVANVRCTHLDLRFLAFARGVPAPPAEESQEVGWFSLDRALGLAGEDGGLRDALRGADAAAATS